MICRWGRIGVLMVLVFWAAGASGGDSAGNGGDLMVCDGQPLSRELLDYFEARQRDAGYELAFPDTSQPVREKLDLLLRRLSQFDPARADYYRMKWNRFEQDRLLVAGPLEDVPDTGDLQIPPGCRVVQLALQRPPAFPSDFRYLIDRALWAELEEEPAQQAGLILHEIIYSEALKLGQENSVRTRHFNAVISSRGFEALTQREYNALAAATFEVVFPISFLQAELQFTVKAGSRFELELESLLKKPIAPNLQWFFDTNAPTWLHLSSDGRFAQGEPSEGQVGSSTFYLIARTPHSNALARVTLLVQP